MSNVHLKELSEAELVEMQNELKNLRTLLRPAFDHARAEAASRELITKEAGLERNHTALNNFVPIGALYTNVISTLLEIEQVRVQRADASLHIRQPSCECKP